MEEMTMNDGSPWCSECGPTCPLHVDENERPFVLDLDDPYFDGQTLPDALRDYEHVHSATGVCVKHPTGDFCVISPGNLMNDDHQDQT